MGDSKDMWTVGDILNAMSGSGARPQQTPEYITRLLGEVQSWLSGAIEDESSSDLLDIATGESGRGYSADLDYLFSRIEWAMSYADVVPMAREIVGHRDAVILSVGPIVLDEGLRMMVDHAALFAAGACRRVWIVSDTWIMADILAYTPHIRALFARGVELRFMLATPWGSSEIPWNKETFVD